METVATAIAEKPTLRLLSQDKLFRTLRKDNPDLKLKDVQAYFAANRDEVLERFAKPGRYKQAKITAPPYSFQIDVIHLPAYKATNGNKDRFFLAIDILSRKAFAYVLKSGKVPDVLKAYKQLLKDAKPNLPKWTPTYVEGDDFFEAKAFYDYSISKSIPVHTGVAKDDHIASGDRLGIVDRCTRTLKVLISKRMAADDDTKWTKWLQEIVELYNQTPNAGAGNQAPLDAYADFHGMYRKWRGQMKGNMAVADKVAQKFSVGQFVRIKVLKGAFDKEGASMSKAVYEITGVTGTKLMLKDAVTGNPYKRSVKPTEVTKVAGPSSTAAPLAPTNVEQTVKRAKVKRKVTQQEQITPDARTLQAPEAAPPVQTRTQKDVAANPATVTGVVRPDHYIVHSIIGKKYFSVNGRKVLKYRVHWDGEQYKDPKWDTWEPLSNLQAPAVQRLIKRYEQSLKNKV